LLAEVAVLKVMVLAVVLAVTDIFQAHYKPMELLL
jgi:hypothetical protein